jgi:uncharacterized iron-regulated membrane protein
MKIHAHSLRALHKWIGLIIGLQFLLWTLSGTIMALLPMDRVAGGERRELPRVQAPAVDQWARVQQQLGSRPVARLTLRPLLSRQVYEVETSSGVELFDSASGKRVQVDAPLAREIASAAYPGDAHVSAVLALDNLSLAVREHELPIWQVDFADETNSTYYVSGSTGQLLERRNDTWRLWDFFWMLHNMDYVNRTSFNHPLIITVGFAAAWLAVTGVWLLFRTGWRSDFKGLGRRIR